MRGAMGAAASVLTSCILLHVHLLHPCAPVLSPRLHLFPPCGACSWTFILSMGSCRRTTSITTRSRTRAAPTTWPTSRKSSTNPRRSRHSRHSSSRRGGASCGGSSACPCRERSLFPFLNKVRRRCMGMPPPLSFCALFFVVTRQNSCRQPLPFGLAHCASSTHARPLARANTCLLTYPLLCAPTHIEYILAAAHEAAHVCVAGGCVCALAGRPF